VGHEDDELRLRAVLLFERPWEKHWRIRIVRALLPSVEASLPVVPGGAEELIVHGKRQAGIARVVAGQTGIKVPDAKGDLNKAMSEAATLWRKWLKDENPDERF
jgi:hypothetical protein